MIWVEAAIYESDLPHVRKGQAARVTLPYAADRDVTGKVSTVYPYLDAASRTGKVRVELPNKDLALKPDMYADVAIDLDHGLALVLVGDEARPRSIDLRAGGGQHALLVQGQRGARLGDALDRGAHLDPDLVRHPLAHEARFVRFGVGLRARGGAASACERHLDRHAEHPAVLRHVPHRIVRSHHADVGPRGAIGELPCGRAAPDASVLTAQLGSLAQRGLEQRALVEIARDRRGELPGRRRQRRAGLAVQEAVDLRDDHLALGLVHQSLAIDHRELDVGLQRILLRRAPDRVLCLGARTHLFEQPAVVRVDFERALGDVVVVEQCRCDRREAQPHRLDVVACALGFRERDLAREPAPVRDRQLLLDLDPLPEWSVTRDRERRDRIRHHRIVERGLLWHPRERPPPGRARSFDAGVAGEHGFDQRAALEHHRARKRILAEPSRLRSRQVGERAAIATDRGELAGSEQHHAEDGDTR